MRKESDYNIEYKKEVSINLSSVDFNFCGEEKIKDDFVVKIKEIENKEEWIGSHKDWLQKNKDKFAELIKTGLISDDKPETIRKINLRETEQRLERVLNVEKELKNNIEFIKTGVTSNLAKFLPNWTADKINIDFTLNKDADFCIRNNNIIVDLSRLSFEKDFLTKTINGVTHELFHAWQKEGLYLSKSKDKASDKNRMLFGALDEGLAVLIGKQDLKKHHEEGGRDYESYKKESFDNFNSFLTTKDKELAKNITSKAFKDMGYFYVVGNEIVKAVFEKEGINKFRGLIEDLRKNGPDEFLQIYRDICKNNKGLLIIEKLPD